VINDGFDIQFDLKEKVKLGPDFRKILGKFVFPSQRVTKS